MDGVQRKDNIIANHSRGLEQGHSTPHSHLALQTHTRFCAHPPRPASGADVGLFGRRAGARAVVGNPSM